MSVSVSAVELPAQSPDSVVYLTKNTNHNQVHYGVKLDKDCQAQDKKPVYAYWRMLEEGDDERAKLMFWEQPGYGVEQPRKPTQPIAFTIRGVPEREIELETFALAQGCGARAYTTIAGRRAVFRRIDIQVSGWANVHRVEIHGYDIDTGQAVSEITHEEAP